MVVVLALLTNYFIQIKHIHEKLTHTPEITLLYQLEQSKGKWITSEHAQQGCKRTLLAQLQRLQCYEMMYLRTGLGSNNCFIFLMT